jgi:hypothetical protein
MLLDFANRLRKDAADQSKFQFISHNAVATAIDLGLLAQ